MTNLVLSQIRVLDPSSKRDEITDLVIRAGTIQPDGATRAGLSVFDASRLIAAPGFWDAHVHFRDPGNAAAETRLSGAQAAAAGGFTRVVTMPNTQPPGDSTHWIRSQIDDPLPVKILPSACVTQERLGLAVADLDELAHNGAAAFTDDGSMVASERIMREAMLRAARLDIPIMDHAVIPGLAAKGVIRECPLARRLGLPLFPPEAETAAVRRDIELCRETACPTHIQHISCRGSVDLIRDARREGLPVTGEASPHHIALACEDIPNDDGNYKMNPPLGNHDDVHAIREGILDGTLTLFATDHAPHTPASKTQGFLKAPFGVIGLETAIGITWKIMVEEEKMPALDWVSRWTSGPAALLRRTEPTLAAGSLADLVLIDPNASWTVNPSTFRSLSRNTPFSGWALNARPVLTICDGHITFSAITKG